MSELTHFNASGEAVMVDVHAKEDTHRIARAEGTITLSPEAFAAVENGTARKGDVLGVARIAGIMAAKRNFELIPLCHNIGLTKCEAAFALNRGAHAITVTFTAGCVGKTGVEMEALTGASVALLTIYDMCKAMDRAMVIGGIRLLEKDGGKSGRYLAAEE